MTRTLTAGVQAEIVKAVYTPVVFCMLDYASGIVYVNSTDRDIAIDLTGASQTYVGAGQLGSVSTIGEKSDLTSAGVSVGLSGIPAAFTSLALENAQGRPAKLWLGFMDDAGAMVADPIEIYDGLIDNSTVSVAKDAVVRVALENRLITWSRPRVRRYTNEDHQQLFPGDKGFEFVSATTEKEILWGVPGSAPVPKPAPPRLTRDTRFLPGSAPGLIRAVNPTPRGVDEAPEETARRR